MISENEYEPILDPEYLDLFQEEFQYPLFDFDTNSNLSNSKNKNNNTTNESYDMKQLQSDFEQKGEISQIKNDNGNETEKETETEKEKEREKTKDKEKMFLFSNNEGSSSYLFSKQLSFSSKPIFERLPSLERFLSFDRAPSFERLPSLGKMPSFTRQPSFPRQRSFTRQPSLDRMPSFGNPNKGLNALLFDPTVKSNSNQSNLRGSNFSNSTIHNDRNLFTRDHSLGSVYKVQLNNNKKTKNDDDDNDDESVGDDSNENFNRSLIIQKKNHKNPIYIPKLQKKSSSQSILFSTNNNNNNNNNNLFSNKPQQEPILEEENEYGYENGNGNTNRNGTETLQDSNSFLQFLNHPNIEMIVGGRFDQPKNNLFSNKNEQNNLTLIKQGGKRWEKNNNNLNNNFNNNKNNNNNNKPSHGERRGKLQKTKTQFMLKKNSKEMQSEPIIITSAVPLNKTKQINLTSDNFNTRKDNLQNSKNLQNQKLTNSKPKLKKGRKKKYKKKKTRVRIKIGTHKNKDKDNDEDSRKRLLQLKSLNKNNSVIIESGKEVFKLLTGQLWVISGGAPQKLLSPYTNKFVQKIGILFSASETEEESFHGQLKYLLSNSRRTFTEFILEILIGILSLKYSENVPDITLKFWKILEAASQLNSTNDNDDYNTFKNIIDENNKEIEIEKGKEKEKEKEREKEKEKLNIQLEEIYQEIYTQKVLMHWFDKRFVERLGAFFNGKDKKQFYEQHLFFLGKSKFILSCLLSANELIKNEDGVPEKYFKLVNLKFENNPLNVYLNNRGKKLNLVKDLIIKYGLNNGSFWNIISKDYLGKMKFAEQNIFDYFPFKKLITNPLLSKLCKKASKEKPQKKRNVSSSNNEKSQVQINEDWLFKKRAI
ncbi:chascon [Anaeramoeba flamelloides]|uniref:Chascon n=1 Tax=Anaeramoeba flamelloides TaxID=1746091 RepID=A0ABQ8Y6D3_9EUKA|nr:chascon [Anaeramoeba flamelloides]